MKRTPVVRSVETERAYADREAVRKNDETNRLYNRPEWRKVSKICRQQNPICQRIGEDPVTKERRQCRRPSTLAHHIKSPRCGGDLLDFKNLIALCASCHPPTEGTEDWQEGRDYVPSNFPKWSV